MSEQPRSGMQLKAWRPFVKNTLRGFATVELPNGLVIRDVTVHVKNGKAWAGLPAKAQMDQEGNPRRIDGKLQYTAVIEWRNRELSDRFSEKLVAIVRSAHPDALNDPQ